MIGKHLSHYRIEAELGRGGMGIVYRARDTKLDRTVAIKVLPASALTSESDRARFYREAKAAASLTHPHIAIIHGVDEAVPEGASSEELRPFIAMEFVDGETLEELIEKGPFKVADAVRIASEVASALQTAHEAEIVHRDIKSANVILSKKGVAKVLDFGLAQTAASTKLTRMGATLGTASFMSPEQARGEQVDHRTDIFSLGVIMYQLVAGRLPFGAEYEQAVIYSILNEDPDPLTALRTGVPMELERIVSKALAKDRALRYQSAADLIADLKVLALTETGNQASATPTPFTSAVATAGAAAADASKTRRTFSVKTLVLAATLPVMITLLITYFLAPSLAPATIKSLDVSLLTRSANGKRIAPFPQAFSRGLAISKAGDQVAFLGETEASWEIVVRDLDNSIGVSIPRSNVFAESPAYSFDGSQLVFANSGQVQIANIGGGLPDPVANVDRPSRGMTWLPDGSIVFAPNSSSGLWIHRPNGTLEQLTVLDESIGENSHRWPHALPNGKGVVFTSKTNDLKSFDDATISVVNVETGVVSTLFRGGMGAMYASGYLLYGKSSGLYAVAMNLESLAVGNEHKLITDDIFVTMASGVANFSVSENGNLVVFPKPEIEYDSVQLIGAEDKREFPSQNEMIWPSLSPSGRRAVFAQHIANDALFMLSLQSGNYVQITTRFNNQNPVWGPDDQRIMFSSDRLGTFDLFEMDVDDPESVKLVLADSLTLYPTFWSVDGEIVLFSRLASATRLDVWMLSLGADTVATPLLTSSFDEEHAVLSNDRAFIAYESDETGSFEVYIRRFPDMTTKRPVSFGSGWRPKFSSDGSRIFYISGEGSARQRSTCSIMVAEFTGGSNPRVTATSKYMENEKCADFELMPDDKTILLVSNSENTPYWEMPDVRLITNWTARIK